MHSLLTLVQAVAFIVQGQGRVRKLVACMAPGCIRPLQYRSLERRRVMHTEMFCYEWKRKGWGAALTSKAAGRDRN